MTRTDTENLSFADQIDSLRQVGQARDTVKGDLAQITSQVDHLHAVWDNLAGETCVGLRSALQQAIDETVGPLDDIVDQLRTTYGNDENADPTNAHSFS